MAKSSFQTRCRHSGRERSSGSISHGRRRSVRVSAAYQPTMTRASAYSVSVCGAVIVPYLASQVGGRVRLGQRLAQYRDGVGLVPVLHLHVASPVVGRIEGLAVRRTSDKSLLPEAPISSSRLRASSGSITRARALTDLASLGMRKSLVIGSSLPLFLGAWDLRDPTVSSAWARQRQQWCTLESKRRHLTNRSDQVPVLFKWPWIAKKLED